MPALPTGTVTLLFIGLEGSTVLLHQLGERYALLLDECRQLLRAAFLQWGAMRSICKGKPSLLPLPAPPMQ
jgi:hypothetical protein